MMPKTLKLFSEKISNKIFTCNDNIPLGIKNVEFKASKNDCLQ